MLRPAEILNKERLFSFEGTVDRSTYFIAYFSAIMLLLACFWVDQVLQGASVAHICAELLSLLFISFVALSLLSFSVRRSRDAFGNSFVGLWVLVPGLNVLSAALLITLPHYEPRNNLK